MLDPVWDLVSDDAKDFIKLLLSKEDTRPDAEQCF
jgi:hypothetical protein